MKHFPVYVGKMIKMCIRVYQVPTDFIKPPIQGCILCVYNAHRGFAKPPLYRCFIHTFIPTYKYVSLFLMSFRLVLFKKSVTSAFFIARKTSISCCFKLCSLSLRSDRNVATLSGVLAILISNINAACVGKPNKSAFCETNE